MDKQLQKQLDKFLYQKEVHWAEKSREKGIISIKTFFILFMAYGWFLAVLAMFGGLFWWVLSKNSWADGKTWAALGLALPFLTVTGYQVYLVAKRAIKEATLLYGYTDEGVFFIEGFYWKKMSFVPYGKIHNIRLDYHEGGHSTIYLMTDDEVKYRGYNFRKGLARHVPTFEDVEGGKEVYEDLRKAWEKYRERQKLLTKAFDTQYPNVESRIKEIEYEAKVPQLATNVDLLLRQRLNKIFLGENVRWAQEKTAENIKYVKFNTPCKKFLVVLKTEENFLRH